MDTVLRTAATEATSQIQMEGAAAFACPAPTPNDGVVFNNPVLPSGYTVTSLSVSYWTGSATTTSCTVNATQLITITVTASGTVQGSGHGTSQSISFAVDNPVAPAVPSFGTATQLVFLSVGQPDGTAAGSPLIVVIGVKDSSGHIVTTDLSPISLSIAAGPTGATLSSSCVGTDFGGVTTFQGCAITMAGAGYELTAASANPLESSATSAPGFTVTPGPAAQLVFGTSPGNGAAGTAFASQPVVTVEDNFSNTVTTDTSTVTLAIGTNPSGGTLTCTTDPVTAVGGVATWAGCKINSPGTGYTLTVTDGTLPAATTGPFTLTAGAAAQLVFTSSPSNGNLGLTLSPQPVVTVEDAGGNTVTGSAASVTLGISSGSGNVACSTNPVTASSGVATFAGCHLTSALPGTFSLKATASGLSTGVSATFALSSGPASQFAFTSSPVSGTATHTASLGPITVQEQDAFGNPATTAETVNLGSSSTGTYIFSATSGGTAVASVSIPSGSSSANFYYGDTASGTPTVTASGALTSGTQSETVNAGAASYFVLQNPTGQTAGTAFNETITAYDANGNIATSYSGTQTVTFSGPANSPSGTAPSYPASVTFNAGTGTASISLPDAQTTTLTGTQGSLTDITTSFTVGPAAANYFVLQNPAGQTAGTAFNEAITAYDAYGNIATSYAGAKTVTFTGPANSPSGTAPSYPASVTFTAGTGTASITLPDAQTTTLTGTQGSLNDITTSFTVAPLAASSFVLQNPTGQTAGTAFNETLTAVDTYGNTATSYSGAQTVTFTGPANSPNATTPTYPASVTFAAGVGTASITLPDAQTTTLTGTQGSLTDITTSFTVAPAAASSFSVITAGNPTAGQSFSGPATSPASPNGTNEITAIDLYGNTATGYTGAKTVVFTGPANSPNGTAPTYPSSLTFTAGSTAVNALSLTLPDAQTTTLTATVGSVHGTSNSITVSTYAANSTQLLFSPATPGPGAVGTAIPNIAVQVTDAEGNVTTDAGSVVLSIKSGSPQSTFTSGTTTVALSNGTATFSGLVVHGAGSYTLTATPSSISGVTTAVNSNPFTVAAGTMTAFSVANPGSQTAGTAFNDSITAVDTYGNTVTSYTGAQTVTFTGPANSPNATAPVYPASVTFTAGAGTASINLRDAQSTTLTATVGSLTGTSSSFTVAPAAASSFVLQNPTGQTAGTAFSESITAYDTYGNTATTYTGAQTVTFTGPANSPNATTPTYPSSVTFAAGVGTASINLHDAQNTTLTATVGTVAGTSSSFVVAPAAASSFVLQNPTGQTAGTAFNETITAYDTYGNTATTYTGAKTVVFTGPGNSPNATTPTYPASVTFAAGVGTASINLHDAQSTTLTATVGTVAGTSSSFTVAPLAASSFSVITAGNPTAGQSFSGPATSPASPNGTNEITAVDTYGNTATTYTGAKTVVFTGPANSPNGTAPTYPSSLTFTAGSTAVNGLSLTLPDAQTTTLTATVGSVSGTSNSITVTTYFANATQLVFSTQPSGGAHNTAFATQPVVHIEDAEGNTTSTTTSVTLAVNTGTGTLTCTTNPQPSIGGVATFTGCKLSAAGTFTLKATEGSLTQATSTSLTES